MWIGLLFACGSLCFAVGPFPGYVQLVGAPADGVTFFVGSIFFTSAAALQLGQALRTGAPRDRWACGVQFAGTLFFNLSTYDAMDEGLSTSATNHLVWAPDALGSICFLVASALALVGRDDPQWRIAILNMAGSVAFGISAVASYVVPDTGSVIDLAAANVTTVIGALCFLAGALLLMALARRPGSSPSPPRTPLPSGRPGP